MGNEREFLPSTYSADHNNVAIVYGFCYSGKCYWILITCVCLRSAERTRALQLCGWGWGWENASAGVERAEAAGTPCRAAALAAFHLRLRTALDVLARAHDPR